MEPNEQKNRGRYVPRTEVTLEGTINKISKEVLPKISKQVRQAEKKGHDRRRGELGEKAEGLRQKLVELHAIRSGVDQIALYGVEEWNRRFVRQSDLLREIGQPKVRELYYGDNSLRDSRMQRLQSWLSSPSDYAIPGQLARTPEGLNFQLTAKELIDRALCLGCLVHPDRLSPRMLQALGIIDWDTLRKQLGVERLSADDVIKAKSNPAVILQFKYILDSARPFDGKQRLLVVRGPVEEVDTFYRKRINSTRPELLSALHVPQEALGKILYFSEEHSGTRSLARRSKEFIVVSLTASLYDSLYGVHRAALYTNDGYEEERAELAPFVADVRSLVASIEKTWTKDATPEVKEKLKEQLRQLISKGSSQFSNAENTYKQRILVTLEHIGQCMDQGNPVIPRAKINQLNSIFANATQRAYDVKKMAEKRFSDHLSIEDTIRESSRYFDAFEKVLGNHLDDVNNGKTLKVTLAKGALQPFREMDIRPFTTFAKKLISAVDEFETAASGTDKAKVREALLKLHLICRLQRFQAGTELLLNKVSLSKPLTLDDVSQSARALQDVLPDRSRYGKNSYRKLCLEYDSFRQSAISIYAKLEEAKKAALEGSSVKGLYKELRKLLKLADLEDAVTKIP